MSHILNHNRTPFDFKLDYSEQWDFFLDDEPIAYHAGNNAGQCVASEIDLNNDRCIRNNHLVSTKTWEYAFNNDMLLTNVGLTGMDNGLIRYDRELVSNSEFVSMLTDSELSYNTYGSKLVLTKVDGNNAIFSYGADIVTEDEQQCVRLSGGFYQGFFKSGDTYKTLPTNIGDGITLEFMIKPDSNIKPDGYTLNDRYPQNNGMFFYMGTRAENKWGEHYDTCDALWTRIANTYFDGDEYIADSNYFSQLQPNGSYFLDTDPYATDYFSNGDYNSEDCPATSDSLDYGTVEPGSCRRPPTQRYYFSDEYTDNIICGPDYNITHDYEGGCDIELDSDYKPTTDDGHSVTKPNVTDIDTDNKFLIFDRTCDGMTADKWIEGTTARITIEQTDPKENYFLLYHRGCGGLTADKTWDSRGSIKYNMASDIYRNAFGLQLTEDGAISYKYAVQDCDSDSCNNVGFITERTASGLVPDGQWHTIHVKFEPVGMGYDIKCDYNTSFHKKMVIQIYVDGRLKLISKELPMFNFKKLADNDDKQETVPFNMSLGGGTQGLCDVVYSDYTKLPDKAYTLEREFGGSLYGFVRLFRFFACPLPLSAIRATILNT